MHSHEHQHSGDPDHPPVELDPHKLQSVDIYPLRTEPVAWRVRWQYNGLPYVLYPAPHRGIFDWPTFDEAAKHVTTENLLKVMAWEDERLSRRPYRPGLAEEWDFLREPGAPAQD